MHYALHALHCNAQPITNEPVEPDEPAQPDESTIQPDCSSCLVEATNYVLHCSAQSITPYCHCARADCSSSSSSNSNAGNSSNSNNNAGNVTVWTGYVFQSFSAGLCAVCCGPCPCCTAGSTRGAPLALCVATLQRSQPMHPCCELRRHHVLVNRSKRVRLHYTCTGAGFEPCTSRWFACTAPFRA